MFVVILSALSSFLLLRGLIPVLRSRVLDHPNTRSSHSQPTPRGGGLSFVVVTTVASMIALGSSVSTAAAFVPLIAFPLAVVGLLDDRFDLPSTWRYLAQLLTTALVLSSSPLVKNLLLSVSSVYWLLFSLLALLVLSVTALINFTNFMDGLDGLLAGCMSIVLTVIAIQSPASWSTWSLVGALLGFLFLNWSPAKVFMGDVGSTYLGAVFAGLLLQAPAWSEAFSYLFVATPLLADAFICVPRRLLSGHKVFQPHRLHLFQRLNQAGWPHAQVSLLYVAATAALALAILAGGLPWVFGLAVLELLLGVWLDQHVAVPFAVASKS